MGRYLQFKNLCSLINPKTTFLSVGHCHKNKLTVLQNRLFSTPSSEKTRRRSIHEPEYLESLSPEIPTYDLLNVQITGYDFSVLESFAKYVHHTAERIGLDVEDSWATPCKKFRVTQLKPESTAVKTEYLLNLYERNVQISDAPSTTMPLFINVIESSIPAGVTLKIHPHLKEHEEIRFVPDLKLKELRTQLDTIKSDREK